MSFTQEQLNTLDNAIAQGALKVKYQDKEVTYRSLDEMLIIKKKMENELGVNQKCSRTVVVYSSGL